MKFQFYGRMFCKRGCVSDICKLIVISLTAAALAWSAIGCAAPTPSMQPAQPTSVVSQSAQPTVASPAGGYQGIVMERGVGTKVIGARIVFEKEDGVVRKEVTSDSNGSYRVELPQGRYRVSASHADYEPYSTGGGFFVVPGANYETGNIDLVRKATAADKPPQQPAPAGSSVQIVVDGSGHKEGPLPVIRYALTEPTGQDIYPLGQGSIALYGIYDSGSTKVVINDQNPPNRVTRNNWGKSDTGHLALRSVQTVNLRLNGLQAEDSQGNVPIGQPGSASPPQLEVTSIAVKPGAIDVTLIGTPVVNRSVAHINYAKMITGKYSGIVAPEIILYRPGDAKIPGANLTLRLEPFGNLVSGDGATPGRRYWLRNVAFKSGTNVVSDQQKEFDFFFDTGTTLTIINDRIASRLGLNPGSGQGNCYGGTNNIYTINSVTMSGPTGLYQIKNAAMCWKQASVTVGDVVIGSNLFDQVQIVLDGPRESLGIIGPTSAGGPTVTPPPPPSGYQGTVTDRNTGTRIAEVQIIFEKEDGTLRRQVTSNSIGSYKVDLPQGRYRVTATHPDFETYSTGTGFFVVPAPGYQVGNIFLQAKPRAVPNQSPTVSISANPLKVTKGQKFVVSLTGADDKGLAAIWWWGEQTGDQALDKAHWLDCNGRAACSGNWDILAPVTGRLKLCANARDGEGKQTSEGSGIPCIQVEVSPSEPVLGGFQGVVTDRDTTAKIGGARIVFEKEDGTVRKETTTASNGGYQVNVPQGRYRVTASHPDYETYSTGGGFFIAPASGYQVANITLVHKPIQSACSGAKVGGFCWYLGADSASCSTVCAAHGGYHEATRTYAGSDGSSANCRSVLSALGIGFSAFYETSQGGLGCFIIPNTSGSYFGYWDKQPTTASATYGVLGRHRACACQR